MRTKPFSLFDNAYALLILAALGWGGNAVAGKLATVGWEPFTLTCARWFAVMLVMTPFSLKYLRQDQALIIKNWWYFIVVCGFFMGLFNLFLYLALNYTSAINVSIEQASMPLLIILANFIFLSQRVTLLQIVGVALSVFGVLITSTHGEPLKLLANGLNKGDAIMLMGCCFYATYTFSLKWRPNVHWLSFIWLLGAGAFLVSIPFSVYEFSTRSISMPSGSDWLILAYVVIVPSIVCQLCFAKSVELIGGNRAGLFINLVPLFGSILAVLIVGEQFFWYHALGMIMVVGGIMLAETFAHAG